MASLKLRFSFNGSIASSQALILRVKLAWLRVGSSCFILSAEILGDYLRSKVHVLSGEHVGTPRK